MIYLLAGKLRYQLHCHCSTYPFSQSNQIRYSLKTIRWFHVVFRKIQSHDSQGKLSNCLH